MQLSSLSLSLTAIRGSGPSEADPPEDEVEAEQAGAQIDVSDDEPHAGLAEHGLRMRDSEV